MEMLREEAVRDVKKALSPESFFFMSPYRSFSTSGCFRRITQPVAGEAGHSDALHQTVKQAFADAQGAGIEKPLLVGAIPFDTTQPSALFIPQASQAFSRTDKQKTSPYSAAIPPVQVVARKEIPEQNTFMSMVEQAAARTATPEVDKIVLSRLIELTTDTSIDTSALLERLIAQNPASFNFHVPLPDGAVLLGASPELLLRQEGRHFSSLPLAGSARRQPDDVLDREAGNRLLASEKDRHEHDLVTQAMKKVLAPHSETLSMPSSPQLITTPTLWHLATPIEGRANPEESALSLACLLHPTPALSGFPHDVAKQIIAELEPFERALFGGIVGWCDAQGNGEWVVTIRCARVHKRDVRLFAGAGIVPASSPLGEWRETGVKLTTMLNVLGLN